jgi:hypothetical protein
MNTNVVQTQPYTPLVKEIKTLVQSSRRKWCDTVTPF